MNNSGQIPSVQSGNAITDANRGWFVGDFINESLGLRHSKDVEIKWGQHKAGEARDEWVTGETRTAIAILIKGKVEVEFRGHTVLLSQEGDYVMWGEGADHRWRMLEDATVITVRWPSIMQSEVR